MHIRGTITIISACLTLAACSDPGADNNVQAVTPVDASPVELESAPDTGYINTKYGFAVTMPEGWAQNAEAANEDGAIFENKALDADVRVSGADNEGDADFQQAIEAIREGTTDAEGAMIGENEYRGAATAEGDRLRIRLLRTPKGQLVSLMVRYPAAQAVQLDPIAIQTLDSLKLNP